MERILATWDSAVAQRAAVAAAKSARGEVGAERSSLRELASMHALDRLDTLSRFTISTVRDGARFA